LAPSFARRLTLGVSAKGWPVQPNSSQRKSSTRIKITFGRGGSSAAQAPNGVPRNVRRDVTLAGGVFRCASATFPVCCSVSTSRVYIDRSVACVRASYFHAACCRRICRCFRAASNFRSLPEVLHHKWTLFVGIDQRRRLARAKIDTLLLEVPRHAGEELLHDRNQ
jgi:hypothetical protein